MKTAEEIVNSIAQWIAGIYFRPAMYVGSCDSESALERAESLLWSLHCLWADAQDRKGEFMRFVDVEYKAAHCTVRGFAGTFRCQNPDATHRACFHFVMQHWKSISDRLGVPLIDMTGHTVTDDDIDSIKK